MPSYYEELIKRYLSDEISESEVRELFDFISTKPAQADLLLSRDNRQAFEEKLRKTSVLPADTSERMHRKLLQEIHQAEKPVPAIPTVQRSPFIRRNLQKAAIAASVLLVLGLSAYFLLFNQKNTPADIVQAPPPPDDVKPPQTNKATITLADGSVVYLDSAGNGQLAMQGNIQLVKLADGQIAYSPAGARSAKAGLTYNTLTNPRGSKVIDMTLADGSHVWLNAGSSVTYPVTFVGGERKVGITGEAYFEIAHNAAMPFKVTKDDMEVTVLGTYFNVNAYDDESNIKVTLLEGSVAVNNKGTEQRLTPGQQAQVQANGKITLNRNVDTEQVMAWKNGLFSFENADLPTVMRQISIWYDIEVVYAGKIPEGRFEGKILRSLSLSQLLNGLTSTSIHFKVEGNNKIIIQPG